MPAQHSTIHSLLAAELQKKVSELPLEFQTIPELFPDGSFAGAQIFFPELPDNEAEADTHSEAQETPSSTVQNTVEKILTQSTAHSSLMREISAEETADVVGKLQSLLQLPPGQLDTESELYLEQQLSELLGIEVSSRLDSQQLLYNTGKIKALPHLKRFPTDSLEQHGPYHYAQIDPRRSAFGWFLEQGKVTETMEDTERYYLALQLYYFPDWAEHSKAMKKWYKYKKVIVINPFDSIAVVCAVGAIGPSIPIRYQFGASPEVIREGKLWSTRSKGKVLVLFVDDPQNQVPLGPVFLGTKQTQTQQTS